MQKTRELRVKKLWWQHHLSVTQIAAMMNADWNEVHDIIVESFKKEEGMMFDLKGDVK